MSEQPAFNKTVVEGVDQVVGKRVYHYVLVSNGVLDAHVTFRKNNGSGEIIWEDDCIAEDKSIPYPASNKPLGFRQNEDLFVQVTGTGAVCHLCYE